jgi:hypothetical protein
MYRRSFLYGLLLTLVAMMPLATFAKPAGTKLPATINTEQVRWHGGGHGYHGGWGHHSWGHRGWGGYYGGWRTPYYYYYYPYTYSYPYYYYY